MLLLTLSLLAGNPRPTYWIPLKDTVWACSGARRGVTYHLYRDGTFQQTFLEDDLRMGFRPFYGTWKFDNHYLTFYFTKHGSDDFPLHVYRYKIKAYRDQAIQVVQEHTNAQHKISYGREVITFTRRPFCTLAPRP